MIGSNAFLAGWAGGALTRAPSVGPAAAGPNATGFGLATAVMIIMVVVLIYALVAALRMGQGGFLYVSPGWAGRVIPVLSVLGLGVAGYLTYVETTQVAAICGPVGDCNAVQASPYARLFGFLPVGLLGMAGYVAILLAWAANRFAAGRIATWAAVALLGMALFGVLFSIYLTYLELYVIYAVCIWCLTSAVIMSLILLFSVAPASQAMEAEEDLAT